MVKGQILTSLPVKYLSSLSHQIFYFNQLSKDQFEKQEIFDFFSESFNIYDRMVELKYKQKMKLDGKAIFS
jgi:hypothetical protein